MKKQPYQWAIYLLGMTLMTAVVWVGLEVYRAYFKTREPSGYEELLKPITVRLDAGVLDLLEAREP